MRPDRAVVRKSSLRPLSIFWRIGMTLTLLAPLHSFAARPVNGDDYQLVITHRVTSQAQLADGRVGLELELTLKNGGSHDLYDLHLYLSDAALAPLTKGCAPARLRTLGAGDQDGVTWTYECLVTELPDLSLSEVKLRIEAVDRATQEIVTFQGTSAESR